MWKCMHHTKSYFFRNSFMKVRNEPQGRERWLAAFSDFNTEGNNNGSFKSKEMASGFDDYFSQVVENIASTIPASTCDPLSQPNRPDKAFSFFYVNTQELVTTLVSLKSGSSILDEFPIFVSKNLADILSRILCDLPNRSLHTGNFPLCPKKGLSAFYL